MASQIVDNRHQGLPGGGTKGISYMHKNNNKAMEEYGKNTTGPYDNMSEENYLAMCEEAERIEREKQAARAAKKAAMTQPTQGGINDILS